MAVWVSQAAADLVSKAAAIILIITIFASLGFEHSVANMLIGKEGGREGGRKFLAMNGRCSIGEAVRMLFKVPRMVKFRINIFESSPPLPPFLPSSFPPYINLIGPFSALNGGPSYLHFFLRNIVPVSIGNIFAGVVLVALSNYLSFGSGGKLWMKRKGHGKGFNPAATSSR